MVVYEIVKKQMEVRYKFRIKKKIEIKRIDIMTLRHGEYLVSLLDLFTRLGVAISSRSKDTLAVTQIVKEVFRKIKDFDNRFKNLIPI